MAAVILAGGKGERLGGVIKANVPLGGVRLLDRVTHSISRSAAVVLVAHGTLDYAAFALGPEHVPIPDLGAEYGGPLAGIAAAVDWCTRQPLVPEFLVSAAVDTPFLPEDFVPRALAALGPGDSAVVARYAGQDYPTNAAWRLAAIRTLPSRVLEGSAPHSLRRLAAEIGAIPLEWPPDQAGDPFANANTPEDLAALEARARSARSQTAGYKS